MTKHELVELGIQWLTAHREELLDIYIKSLAGLTSSAYYSNLSPQQLHALAANNLDGLIRRLNGASFDHVKMTALFVTIFKSGIALEDLVSGTDHLLGVFRAKAAQDLALTQPQVYQALLDKVLYVGNLLKSTMAAAAIEVRTQV